MERRSNRAPDARGAQGEGDVLSGLDSLRSSFAAGGSMNLSASADTCASGTAAPIQNVQNAQNAQYTEPFKGPAAASNSNRHHVPVPAQNQQKQVAPSAGGTSADSWNTPSTAYNANNANDPLFQRKPPRQVTNAQNAAERPAPDFPHEIDMDQMDSPRMLHMSSTEGLPVRPFHDLFPSDESSADEIFGFPSELLSAADRRPGYADPSLDSRSAKSTFGILLFGSLGHFSIISLCWFHRSPFNPLSIYLRAFCPELYCSSPVILRLSII